MGEGGRYSAKKKRIYNLYVVLVFYSFCGVGLGIATAADMADTPLFTEKGAVKGCEQSSVVILYHFGGGGRWVGMR